MIGGPLVGQSFEVTEHDRRAEVLREVLDLVPDVDAGRRRLVSDQ
jgi:hypothetical protein